VIGRYLTYLNWLRENCPDWYWCTQTCNAVILLCAVGLINELLKQVLT
jgi:hypothetical protein